VLIVLLGSPLTWLIHQKVYRVDLINCVVMLMHEHYSCPNSQGVLLENEGGSGSAIGVCICNLMNNALQLKCICLLIGSYTHAHLAMR